MINVVDIGVSIVKALKYRYGDKVVYSFDDIEQGAEVPCFFIGLKILKSNYVNRYHYESNVGVVITFFNDKKDKKELWDKVSGLLDIFHILKIKDRYLSCLDYESEVLTDDCLQFSFMLNFKCPLDFTDYDNNNPAEFMKKLYIKGVD